MRWRKSSPYIFRKVYSFVNLEVSLSEYLSISSGKIRLVEMMTDRLERSRSFMILKKAELVKEFDNSVPRSSMISKSQFEM